MRMSDGPIQIHCALVHLFCCSALNIARCSAHERTSSPSPLHRRGGHAHRAGGALHQLHHDRWIVSVMWVCFRRAPSLRSTRGGGPQRREGNGAVRGVDHRLHDRTTHTAGSECAASVLLSLASSNEPQHFTGLNMFASSRQSTHEAHTNTSTGTAAEGFLRPLQASAGPVVSTQARRCFVSFILWNVVSPCRRPPSHKAVIRGVPCALQSSRKILHVGIVTRVDPLATVEHFSH